MMSSLLRREKPAVLTMEAVTACQFVGLSVSLSLCPSVISIIFYCLSIYSLQPTSHIHWRMYISYKSALKFDQRNLSCKAPFFSSLPPPSAPRPFPHEKKKTDEKADKKKTGKKKKKKKKRFSNGIKKFKCAYFFHQIVIRSK